MRVLKLSHFVITPFAVTMQPRLHVSRERAATPVATESDNDDSHQYQ